MALTKLKIWISDFGRTVISFAGLTAWLAVAMLVVLFALSQVPATSGLLPWGPMLRVLDARTTRNSAVIDVDHARIEALEKDNSLMHGILQETLKSNQTLRAEAHYQRCVADIQWCDLMELEAERGADKTLLEALKRRCRANCS